MHRQPDKDVCLLIVGKTVIEFGNVALA